MDSDAELEARIRTDYKFFTSFIDMVPSHAYFDVETRAQIQGRDDDGEEGEQIDDDRKKVDVVAKKRFQSHFHDPLRQHTISELQEKLDSGYTASKPVAKSGKKSRKPSNDSDITDPIVRLEELRENIRTKIAGLKAKRGGLTTREEIQKAYLKKKVSNVNQRMNKKQRNTATKTPDPPRPKLGSPSQSSAKPVFNKEGQMVFSKFDFITDSTSSYMKKKKDASKKRGAERYTGKDAKKILHQVEKEHERIEELKQTDEIAAQALEDKAVWQSVIAKASGVKVKDNPELLKKAIKRKEKGTERSRKKWKQREMSVVENKQKRQDKRQSNIQARKDGRKSKKIARAKKKGRMVPGF